MPALKVAFSFWLLAISLFIFTPIIIFAAEGDACTYAELCDNGSGQRSCSGSRDSLDICKFDTGIAPNCSTCTPIPSSSSTPTSTTPTTSTGTPTAPTSGGTSTEVSCDPTKQLCPVSSTNYRAAQNLDFFGQNFGHFLSCLGESKPLDSEPCLVNVTKISEATGLLETTPMISSSLNGGGAIGLAQTISLALYAHPPVRTAEYIAYVKSNIGIVKPAYAQVGGSGSNVLSPILKLWTITRNLAYLLMIVIFLVVGFMIMFRKKISQQAVISIQQALPGLIIGLILITFSYLIASLLVDVAFLGSLVVGKLFESQGIINPNTADQLLKDNNVLNMFSGFFSLSKPEAFDQTVSNVLSTISVGVIGWIVNLIAALVGCSIGGNLVGGVVGAIPKAGESLKGAAGLLGCAGGAAGFVIGKELIISWLLYGILMIALLFSMFKLLFKLLGNYVSIMVLTVTAPLQFLFGALPGNQGVFESWVKSMLCNILAFPAVFLTFLFAAFLLGPGAAPLYGIKAGADFTAATGTLPLIGGFPVDLIRLLLAYAVLLGSPAVPDLICSALKVDSKTGQAITGAARGSLTGGAGLGFGFGSLSGQVLFRGDRDHGGLVPEVWKKATERWGRPKTK